MPKFVIEREIPGAGKLSSQELRGISQKSCGVLRELGSQIQWLQSYVTDDKIYCVYVAPNEDMVRKHAQQGGFPAAPRGVGARRLESLGRRWFDHCPYPDDFVRGECAFPRVLAHHFLVRRDVDAVDLVVRDVAVNPLDLRPHLSEHAA